MGIKQTLNDDHIPVNKYTLLVIGLPPITFTKLSGMEQETDVVDLPDRTRATGGNTQAFEVTVEVPLHHSTEIVAMNLWFQEGQDPVSATYKKAATLVLQSGTGSITRTYAIEGMWVSKRKTPDLDFADEGAMAVHEYTLQADDATQIT